MYIRKVTHNDTKNQKGYHTFKLVESIRTERGPRQRMLLNLGTDFTLPEKQWKDLANHIEEILIGQESLFSYPEEIETLAYRYARKIIRYHGETLSQADSVSPAVDEADYQLQCTSRARCPRVARCCHSQTCIVPDWRSTLRPTASSSA